MIPPAAQISSHAVKAVLVAIDQFGRTGECWASQTRIAAAANVSRRVCQRAIARLIEISYIVCTRTPGSGYSQGGLTNRYRIVWSELAVSVRCAQPRRPDETPDSAGGADVGGGAGFGETGLPSPDQCAIMAPWSTDQCATSTDQCATMAHKAYISDNKTSSSPLTPQPAFGGGWEEVVVELVNLGMGTARRVVEQLSTRADSSPDRAVQLVAYYRARPGAWGLGALQFRMLNDHSALAIDQGWPPPSKSFSDRETSARRTDDQVRGRRAMELIREGRRRRLSDDQIAAALEAAGLSWEDA